MNLKSLLKALGVFQGWPPLGLHPLSTAHLAHEGAQFSDTLGATRVLPHNPPCGTLHRRTEQVWSALVYLGSQPFMTPVLAVLSTEGGPGPQEGQQSQLACAHWLSAMWPTFCQSPQAGTAAPTHRRCLASPICL